MECQLWWHLLIEMIHYEYGATVRELFLQIIHIIEIII